MIQHFPPDTVIIVTKDGRVIPHGLNTLEARQVRGYDIAVLLLPAFWRTRGPKVVELIEYDVLPRLQQRAGTAVVEY